MNLLTKQCEACGTKINKLQSIWNIYFLKTGDRKIICESCGIQYKTYGIMALLGSLYAWSGASFLFLILVVSFIDSFHLKLGIEVWLYAFIVLNILEFIIMMFVPLKQVEEKPILG